MTDRKDRLHLSLGPAADEYRPALQQLALAINLPGRKGDGSISQLVIRLAELYLEDDRRVTEFFNTPPGAGDAVARGTVSRQWRGRATGEGVNDDVGNKIV